MLNYPSLVDNCALVSALIYLLSLGSMGSCYVSVCQIREVSTDTGLLTGVLKDCDRVSS